jgi:hypothetical protein
VLEHVLEVAIRIVSIELGGLDEAHDGGGTLTGTQRSGKEPVGSPKGHRPYSVFDMVVVDCFPRRRAIGGLAAKTAPDEWINCDSERAATAAVCTLEHRTPEQKSLS